MKIGIIFDLDGTLLDTLADLHSSVNHTLTEYGLPQRTQDEVRRFVGNGARRLIEQALPGLPGDPPVDRVLADYQKYYNATCNDGLTCPYPGILEVLEQLRGQYPLAVVSNKPDPAVKVLCRQYFGDIYALGVADGCPRKPAPDMVKKAMQATQMDACVYVGDSDVDVLTAKNAGAPCVSVLWGFRDREEIEAVGGKYFCERAEDLPAVIKAVIEQEL